MKIRKPLSRSVTIFCALFLVVLSVVLSVVIYNLFKASLYKRYEDQMKNILTYVDSHIDHDDLAECAKTLVRSEKYEKLQVFFDDFIDHYGIHYLYVMCPVKVEDKYSVMNIITASTQWEKENTPEYVLPLGYVATDEYEDDLVQELIKIYNDRHLVFFEEETAYSTDYTAAITVSTSTGEAYGLLCVDMLIDDVKGVVYRNTFLSIIIILGMGLGFIALFLWWMRSNVTNPIARLEKSVSEFANGRHDKYNPDDLVFKSPEIHSENEVQSLSCAVSKMSEDMRDYVKDILAAEQKVGEMNVIAYEDALTRIGNKAAYDQRAVELNQQIILHDARFAIIMVDINNLKKINDNYGHEKGNEYILGCCNIMKESGAAIYRIGGDEFVLILEGDLYDRREQILTDMQKRFANCSADENASPWHRYSAACGMTAFLPVMDNTIEEVFRRADELMYQEKIRMKTSAH